MVGCFLAAWTANWMFHTALPGSASAAIGRSWFIFPLIPMNAVGVLFAGIYWRRRLRASTIEGVGALLVLELILYALVTRAAGERFTQVPFNFWAAISLAFVPWWLLGVWIGRPRRHT